MKIVEHTDRHMELANQNRRCLWGLLFAAPFAISGAIATAFTVKVTALTSQRTISGILGTERVTIDKKYLLYGDRQTVLPLSTIQQAEVRELLFSISSDRQPLYTIDLVTTDAKKVSLSVSSPNLTECQRLVNIIDRFVRQHQSSLECQYIKY